MIPDYIKLPDSAPHETILAAVLSRLGKVVNTMAAIR